MAAARALTSSSRSVAAAATRRRLAALPRVAFSSSGGISAPLRRAAVAVRASATAAAKAPDAYAVEEKGAKGTLEYRVCFRQHGKPVSPWHEIPLWADSAAATLNFVCEIPKNTSAKMEVATDEPGTPIKQDSKKGAPRFYPYDIPWNYGLLPQTWEDPDHANAELGGVMGDNDPVDVVEIGAATLATGGVYAVKPLGVLAMIDDGELDWKVVALRADDPKASAVETLDDVEREFPGELKAIMEWFRDYKIPDGKPPNAFGYDGACRDKAFALAVVEETHGFYAALKSGRRANTGGLSLI